MVKPTSQAPTSQAPTSPAPADDLLETGPAGAIELSEAALDDVAGGADVTVNKQKSADKAYQAMDAYIKG